MVISFLRVCVCAGEFRVKAARTSSKCEILEGVRSDRCTKVLRCSGPGTVVGTVRDHAFGPGSLCVGNPHVLILSDTSVHSVWNSMTKLVQRIILACRPYLVFERTTSESLPLTHSLSNLMATFFDT